MRGGKRDRRWNLGNSGQKCWIQHRILHDQCPEYAYRYVITAILGYGTYAIIPL